jgi:outer membrane protein assembly factor BamB
MNVLRLTVFAILIFVSAIHAPVLMSQSAVGWTRFHGQDGRGDAGDATIPSTWDDSDYTWRRKLGSRDVGSPIVVEGKVYYLVSKPESRTLSIESLDLATGGLRWSKDYAQSEYHLHSRNTFASGTPAGDSENVFIAFADPQHTYLKCLDHDGNEVWSRDFGPWQSQHGFGTSPRIFGDMVLLLNSQQAEQLDPGEAPGTSRLIAVDRNSGATIWEAPLTATRTCYGVPAVADLDGVTQIIDANTGDGMFGLDPKTGKMLWNLKVFDMRVCSTPLIAGDLAIGSSGSGGGGNHLVAVRIPKPGQQPEQVYRIERGAPYVPTPVLRGNRLYMVDDKGIASCVDVETGKTLWLERLGGRFGASPIAVGDKLLMISLDGEATVLRAGDEFEKLGEIDLGGPVGATPAFAEGRLLIRVDDELRCLGGKAI